MFISYASNFEDVLLNRLFKDVDDGFYIDIGADHPVGSSTTKSFYDRGWTGINVEPGPNFAILKRERPRDINLKAVVTDRDGEVQFFLNHDLTATSSVFEHMDPALAGRVQRRSILTVQSYSLNRIVDEFVMNRPVSFLKIDAEGSEHSIIEPTNWEAFRPIVIVAEATQPFSSTRIDCEWNVILQQNRYIEVYFDGVNVWFIREENKDLQSKFSMPVNLLDNYSVFDPEKELLRTQVRYLNSVIAESSNRKRGVRNVLKWLIGLLPNLGRKSEG